MSKDNACMCGALDCKLCRPENFYKGVYIDDWDEFNKDKVDELLDDKAAAECDDYQSWIDNQGEIGGECSDYKN